jgi:hypothetical protein
MGMKLAWTRRKRMNGVRQVAVGDDADEEDLKEESPHGCSWGCDGDFDCRSAS